MKEKALIWLLRDVSHLEQLAVDSELRVCIQSIVREGSPISSHIVWQDMEEYLDWIAGNVGVGEKEAKIRSR